MKIDLTVVVIGAMGTVGKEIMERIGLKKKDGKKRW